jgi:uncharacterized protein YtpQ (UPF0354 family)
MQLLGNRLTQHNKDVQHKRKSTALCEHTTDTGHSVDIKKASIVCFENNDKKRKIREAIEIMKCKTAVNYKADVDGVMNLYSPVIKRVSPRD